MHGLPKGAHAQVSSLWVAAESRQATAEPPFAVLAAMAMVGRGVVVVEAGIADKKSNRANGGGAPCPRMRECITMGTGSF